MKAYGSSVRRHKTKADLGKTKDRLSRYSAKKNTSASSMNFKRSSAFDDETTGMQDDTTTNNEDMTFMTSTTDYIQGSSKKKGRNLHDLGTSFDSDGTPISISGDKGSLYTEDSKGNHAVASGVRRRLRQQEKQWDRDRQKRTDAVQQATTSPSRRKHQSRYAGGDSDSDSELALPRSSRQLGARSPVQSYGVGRDGYDSDSYSIQKLRRSEINAKRYNDYRQEKSQSSYHYRRDPKQEMAHSTASSSDLHMEANGKVKMTKMEKIRQLQEKNNKYKEEYKKTYIEKKEFKKKYEDKRAEVVSLTTEIENYMKETGLLKKQLTKASEELDQVEDHGLKDQALISKLQKDLQQTRGDLKEALSRLSERKLEIEQLREIMKRKDDQIESLTLEVSRQIGDVQNMQAQMSIHEMGSNASNGRVRNVLSSDGDFDQRKGADTNELIQELREENENVKAELNMTLNRAAEMVKNRESTIEILRKENHELKELLDIRDMDDDRTTTSQKIQKREDIISQLEMEIAGLKEIEHDARSDKKELKRVIQEREAELKHAKNDVEALKKMVKRAEKETHKAKKEVEERDYRIEAMKADYDGVEMRWKETERRLDETNKLIADRDEEIHDLQEEIIYLKERENGSYQELDDARAAVKAKESEIKSLFQENESLRADLLHQKEELNEKRKKVVLELEETKLREKDLRDQLAESEEMIRKREEAIDDLLKEVEELKQSTEDRDQDYNKEITKRQENVTEMLKDLNQMREACKKKDEELQETKKMVKDREEAIEDLLRDIENLKTEAAEAEANLSAQAKKLEKEVKSQQKEIARMNERMDEISRLREETQVRLEEKTQQLQEREDSNEELLQDLEDLKVQYAEERKKWESNTSSTTDDDKASRLEQELEHFKALVQEKEEKLSRVSQEKTELSEKIQLLEQEKERLQQVQQERQSSDRDDDDNPSSSSSTSSSSNSDVGESRSYLQAQQEVMEDEIRTLTEQLNGLQEELDELHRQNSILNEEVEDWEERGGNLELQIQRLKDELEEARARVNASDLDASHYDMGSVGGVSTGEGGDQQAMMLEAAMAERQRKSEKEHGKGVWGLLFNKSEEEDGLDENQKRIRELEAIKDAQAEEIHKIKSDYVKLTTAARNENYQYKKKISDLEGENEAYKCKVELLLRRLAQYEGNYGGGRGEEDEKKMDDHTSCAIASEAGLEDLSANLAAR